MSRMHKTYQYREPGLYRYNKLNMSVNHLKATVKKPLELNVPDIEAAENKLNRQNSILILLACKRDSGSKFAKLPYDIVKMISEKVAECDGLMYLPIIINGKMYRMKLEPVPG